MEKEEFQKLMEDFKKETAGEIKGLLGTELSTFKDEQNKLIQAINKTPEEKDDELSQKIYDLARAVAYKDRDAALKIAKQVTSGSFMVPIEYTLKIWELLQTYGVARRNCSIIPMKSNTAKIPRWLTDMTMEWVGSDHVKPVISGEGDSLDLTCKKLAGIVLFDQQTLDDAVIDFVAFMKPRLANAWAKAEDNAVFLGDTSVGISGLSQVATQYVLGSPSILNMTADDLKHLTEAVPDSAINPNCKFYMSRSVFNIIRNLKAPLTGHYIYQKPSEKTPGTIWDFPYEIVPILPGRGADAPKTKFVYFGDLNYVLIGDRKTLEFKESEEATIKYTVGETEYEKDLFQMDMKALKAVVREAILVVFPNAFSVLRTASACS